MEKSADCGTAGKTQVINYAVVEWMKKDRKDMGETVCEGISEGVSK